MMDDTIVGGGVSMVLGSLAGRLNGTEAVHSYVQPECVLAKLLCTFCGHWRKLLWFASSASRETSFLLTEYSLFLLEK